MSEHPFACPECSKVGVRYDSSVFAGELTVSLECGFCGVRWKAHTSLESFYRD